MTLRESDLHAFELAAAEADSVVVPSTIVLALVSDSRAARRLDAFAERIASMPAAHDQHLVDGDSL